MKENKIPFKLKENIELTITGLGSSGEGVGKKATARPVC